MKKLITLWMVLALMCVSMDAQNVQLTASAGFGPFTSGTAVSNTFSIQGYPTGAVADSVVWQIVNKDGIGGALRVVRSAITMGTTWQTTMGDLPFLPMPKLNATVGYTLNGVHVSRQLSATIAMNPPVINWTSTNNWAGINIGSAFNGRYGISGCPPGTTRIVLYLHPIFGANLDSVVRTGTNLDSASIAYNTTSHRGSLTVQAVATFPGAPTGGYLIAKAIPDILPSVRVKSSLGFGPFVSGRTAYNTFTIDSTLGAFATASFTFTVNGRYGTVYQVGKQSVNWQQTPDQFQITTNMGDLPPYSMLRVDLTNLSGNVASTQMVPISIAPPEGPPLFTMRRLSPLVFNGHGLDSIVLDTLPARTMRSKLSILTPTAQLYKDTTQKTGTFGYLTRSSIRFDGGSLPLHTHTLRAEFWNDYSLDPTEFDYYFDVRDTTVPYIFATSYGPFVQSDSATFSVGVTDLRASQVALAKRIGWFQIIDTITGAVLQRSGLVSLDTVKRVDSIWWADSLSSRGLIQTALLPVSAGLRFIDVGLNSNSDTLFKSISAHPLLMVQAPGVLTASAGYGPFIAGRRAPNTFRIDSLPTNTKSVEFVVTGTVNTSNVDSLLLTQIVANTAQFTTNMAMLPVNARLRVTVKTENGPDEGVTLERFLYTIPDTLAMQPSLKFDTLTFAWQTSSAGSRTQINGPAVIPDTFTIRRLPAQTERVTVATFDLQGNKIDSTMLVVPYTVRFDSNLVVKVPFKFTSFATDRVEFRIFSTGGIPEGITYTRPIVVTRAPFTLTVRRYMQSPPTLDTQSVHQGSFDQLDLTTRVINPGSNYGFAPNVVIDSTKIRFITCRGARVDSLKPTPAASNPASNIVSDSTFTVTPLPLITTRAEVTVYSKMLTFPAQGFVYSDTIRIIPGPITYASLRGDFPTFRVNDTVRKALYNPYTLSQLPLIDSISDIRVVNKTNNVVARYPNRIPNIDSVRFIVNVDSAVFTPDGSPYRILAQANYTVCSEKRTYAFAIDTFSVSRVLPDPVDKNFVWSSAGWGPFHQGKGVMSRFLASFRPAQFITSQDTLGGDQLTVTLRGVNAAKVAYVPTLLTVDSIVPKGGTIPDVWKFPTNAFQIGGWNVGSWFNLEVKWTKLRTAGNVVQNTWNYYFPMTYLPFPPQPIVSSDGWGPFDQSVTAGSSGMKTMQHGVTVTDSVGSNIIDSVRVWMIDYKGKGLDSLNMSAGNILGTGMDQVSIYKLQNYDMAQFPWPSIARDNKNVTMKIGYFFTGNQLLGSSQNQSILMNPRPYWLNNSVVTATSVNSNIINLTVSTPLPTTRFTTTLPLLGSLPFTMGDANGRLALEHKVTYNTDAKAFGFQLSDIAPLSTFYWNPVLGNIGVASIKYTVTAADGATDDAFTAIRRFEPDASGKAAQNLRLRAMVDAKFTISPTTIFKVVEKVLQLLEMIPAGDPTGAVSFAPTFALSIGSEQLMNINLGVDTSDQMTHMGIVPNIRNASPAYANLYPTALSSAFIVDFSFGGEIKFVKGFFGVGLSLNNILRFNSGSTYQGALSNVRPTDYRLGLSDRVFVVVDVSVFWGLYRREIYRGQLISYNTPFGTPAFLVYPLAFNAFLQSSWYDPKGAGVETPQADTTPARQPLPAETPVYYSTPSVDADDSTGVVVWTEHSLRTGGGSVMLGRIDSDSQTFKPTAVVATGRNAVHDPIVRLLRNDGTSLVVWNENKNEASAMGYPDLSPQLINRLLRSEDLHAAIVDSKNNIINSWVIDDQTGQSAGRVDGKATVVVTRDGKNALIAWPVQVAGDTSSDIMAVLLTDSGSGWITSAAKIVAETQGLDEWLDAMPVGNSGIELVWKNTRTTGVGETHAEIMTSHFANGQFSAPTVLASENANSKLQAIALDGNGDFGVLAIATALRDTATNQHSLSIASHEFTSAWQAPTMMPLEALRGTMGDLDVTVGSSGRAHIVADVTYPTEDGKIERKSYVYSAADASSNWVDATNSSTIYDAQQRVWSMSSAVGPNNTMYVVTQELDSTYGNVQEYGNGIQVGPSRINTVLRALRMENDRLVSVPFNGRTVGVEEDRIEKNLRYPSSLYAPYPNPTSGDAVVSFVVQQRTHVQVDVVDVTGTVMTTLVNNDLADGVYDVSIPISTWPQGCYTIRMLTASGELMSKTFTVIR